jgi:hypothetical protein
MMGQAGESCPAVTGTHDGSRNESYAHTSAQVSRPSGIIENTHNDSHKKSPIKQHTRATSKPDMLCQVYSQSPGGTQAAYLATG